MCGRFTLRTPAKVIAEQFGLPPIDEGVTPLPPRYNIAPTQSIFAVRQPAGGDQRQAVMLHWGLIPSWAKDPSIGNRMINARGETVDSKPSFRKAFRTRRCLIVTDGYYEWQKTGGAKQPYYFHRADDQPFAFAGLWESWSGREGAEEKIESATIITTAANDLSRDIHDRMPVILEPSSYDTWLDCDREDLPAVQRLLRPVANDFLVAEPVSTLVNKPTNDSPACIEPMRTLLD
jgi:putative SOS response-associated peptidase YedK